MDTRIKKAFDLSDLDQADTATIPLVHPATGEEIGATATVYGQDSDTFKKETHKLSDKCAEYSRRNRGKTIPNEDYARLDKAKVVACTKSIDGLTYNGAPLTDVAEIFERFPCFHEQVVQAMLDRSGFLKGSPAK